MTNLIIHGITAFIITSGGAIATAATAGALTGNVWAAAIATGLVMAAKDVQSRLAQPPKKKNEL